MRLITLDTEMLNSICSCIIYGSLGLNIKEPGIREGIGEGESH